MADLRTAVHASALTSANDRLKEAALRCSLQQRGDLFYLVATLPHRDGAGRKQQKIPLGRTTLQQAEAKAFLLGSQLRNNAFNWHDWAHAEGNSTFITCGEFRKRARMIYEQRYTGEGSWTAKWDQALKNLPPDGTPCTRGILVATVEAMKPKSASRRDRGFVLSTVAKTLEIEGHEDVLAASKGYGRADVVPRDLPTDEQILENYKKIRLPHFKWMFGTIAIFGLRPHEAATVQFDEDGYAEIDERTKTGFHVTPPNPSAWVEIFKPYDIVRPDYPINKITTACNAHNIRVCAVEFPLYHLRHCFAIRCMEKAVPMDVAAGLMGHSPDEHYRTYRRWLNRERYKKMLKGLDL